jgi:adenylate kinase family enzyme
VSRIVLIGNAGGGKSTLARKLAQRRGLQHVEIDSLLWQQGWKLTPSEIYERRHAEIIAGDDWLIDGLGRQATIPDRIARATEIVLIDMPLWMHFWLAAERQIAWSRATPEHAPGGITQMPSTEALFRTIWEVEQTWMPELRARCQEAEKQGKTIIRLADVDALDAFAKGL